MNNTIGICLAAGTSKRFGSSDKLAADVDGTPLGMIAVSTAMKAKLDQIIVVTNERLSEMWNMLNEQIIVVSVPDGSVQSDSIKMGINYAGGLGAEAVLIFLADQPLISVHDMDRLITSFCHRKRHVFACYGREGEIAPPVLCDKSLFPEIKKLKGDHGAKRLLMNRKEQGIMLEAENKDAFFDVDTKEDYLQLLRMLEK